MVHLQACSWFGSLLFLFPVKQKGLNLSIRALAFAVFLVSNLCADETMPARLAKHFSMPDKWVEDRGAYRSPLQFSNGAIAKSPQQWQQRREEILRQWHELMGAWPPPMENPELEVIESMRRENFQQLKVRLNWVPGESTVGYLLIPDRANSQPAVITVYYEPETAIGEKGEHRDYAYQLTKRGFVTLSLGTTEATRSQTFGLYYPSIDDAKVQPLSMLAYAASTARRALAKRPEVDATRIGIVGHSFGGKWAMFASCLDDQFAAAAWSDPGIVFQDDRPSINYWEPWYLGYHKKPWRKRGLITIDNPAKGVYPELIRQGRDLHELHALMAPRPILVSGGSEDPESRWQPLSHTIEINRLLGYKNRVGMTNRVEHSPNAESNEVIYQFFQYFLQPDKR